MSVLTFAVGTIATLSFGGVIWWMKQTSKQLQTLHEMNSVLSQAQATHFHQLNQLNSQHETNLSHMASTLHTLREIFPDIDANMNAHAQLNALSHPLSSEQIHDLTQTLTQLVGHQAIESIHSSSIEGVHKSFFVKILKVFEENQVSIHGLNLDGDSLTRIGMAAYHLQFYDWAEQALGCAYAISPGLPLILEALQTIAQRKNDVALERHYLEARLQLEPDNEALLRAHAHLLAALGDEEAERPVQRLKALGVDTAADQSLLAGLMARAGSRSEALDAIEKALKEDPNQAKDWFAYAELLLAEGEEGFANEAVDKCLALDRQFGEAWALKAQLLAQHYGQERQALKAATHAVALNAGGVDAIFLKSELLELEGSHVTAEETLLKALEMNPTNGELRARIANKYLLLHKVEDAETILQSTPQGIDHPLLHAIEGRLHLAYADRKRDGSGQTDEHLLAAATKAFEGALTLDRELGVAWLGLARTQRLLGQLSLAEESLTRARRLMEDHDPSVATEFALLSLQMGQLADAQSYVDEAEVRGNSAVLWYVKGNIETRKGKYTEAETYYTNCLTQDASHIRARLNRSSIYLMMNEPQKALDDTKLLLDMAPNLGIARVRKGEALMRLQDWEGACQEFKHVLEKAPHHVHAMTQLASCYLSMGRPERAESPLNEALVLEPNHSPAWHQRGLLYLEWGKHENALADFEAAARADPYHLESRVEIAQLYDNDGRPDEALAAWRAVLAVDDNHSKAITKVASLEQHHMAHH